MTKLLEVKKNHVFVRWHQDFAATYHRSGFEDNRPRFDNLLKERRLIVDQSEYDFMFANARHSMETNDVNAISLFDRDFLTVEKNVHGILPSQLFDDEFERPNVYDTDANLLLTSKLTQEVGNELKQEVGRGYSYGSSLMANTLNTNNSYVNMESRLQAICGKLDMAPDMLHKFESKFTELIMEFDEIIHRKLMPLANTGEFMSSMAEVETRTKYERKRSATDPRNARRPSKKHSTNTKLCIESITGTQDI